MRSIAWKTCARLCVITEYQKREEKIMKSAEATGLFVTDMIAWKKPITVRAETTNGFSTLSLSDDKDGVMLQVVCTKEVRKVLKSVMKQGD